MFSALLLLTAWQASAQPAATVWDVINASATHTSLAGALIATGLDALLQDPNSTFTVFAPDDDAFTALNQSYFDLANTEILTQVLAYHVLGVEVPSSEVPTDPTLVPTLLTADLSTTNSIVGAGFTGDIGGQRLKVQADGVGGVTAEGFSLANVNAPDLLADNGVVHSVNAVILPPLSPSATLSMIDDFSILVSLLVDLGLVDTVDGLDLSTYFLPPNAAFETFLDGTNVTDLDENSKAYLLLYHLLPVVYADFGFVAENCVDAPCPGLPTAYPPEVQLSGQSDAWTTLTVDATTTPMVMTSSEGSADITATDVLVSNGVVHVVDAVLVPAGLGFNDLVTMVIDDSDLSILEGILTLPAYADVLDVVATATAMSPYTVCAPTDAAFTAEGISVDYANMTENVAAVTDILLYHVMQGFDSQELASSYYVTTSSYGSEALLSTALNKDGFVILTDDFINGTATQSLGATISMDQLVFYTTSPSEPVTVSGVDMWATNGIIQKIDMVLFPPGLTSELLSNPPSTLGGEPTFNTLIDLANRVGLLESLDVLSAGDFPLTAVAPTDAAFAAVDPAVLASLTNHQVAQILMSHLLVGPVWPSFNPMAYPFPGNSTCETSSWMNSMETETNVTWCADGMGMLATTTFSIGGTTANTRTPMLLTSNLVVYAIDTVLLPIMFEPTSIMDVLEFNPSTSILYSLLDSNMDLADALADPESGMDWTVFAPVDTAFENAMDTIATLTGEQVTQVLIYHLLMGKVAAADITSTPMLASTFLNGTNGGIPADYDMSLVQLDDLFQQLSVVKTDDMVYVNSDSMVTEADNMDAANGIVHLVDTVIVPPASLVDTTVANGFNTVVALVTQLGLADLLNSLSKVTAFLPNDQAFTDLLAPWGDSLESFSNETITQILLYHLVPTVAYLKDVTGQELTVPTALSLDNGSTFEELMIDGNTAMLNTTSGNMATIIETDILTASGVIHGINAVLIPAGVTLPPVPTPSSSPSPMEPAGTTGAAESPSGATPSASESPEDLSAGQRVGPSVMMWAVIVAVFTLLV